jgi:SAM-dependent methyltransferase
LPVRVTREIADHLAKLARELEKRRDPEAVATFLMRCLFTMFAQNVGLLPKDAFVDLLQEIVDQRRPDRFRRDVELLWQAMDKGDYDPNTKQHLKKFNGGLFASVTCFDLAIEEIGVLLEAARRDWSDVEPAIFGTLLERALDPAERHRLGAHYTPRAYVERLVMPTVIEPLREEWAAVQASAMLLESQGKPADALAEIRRFHESLCRIRVLDPACGTGNFLYVSLELMKRLEGEVIEAARALGADQYFLELDRHTVDPHQFLGIELNPRAAVIAELVLWIGYLQWHFRTRGKVAPAEPVLKNFKNIKTGDALIAFGGREIVRDAHGRPVTRWDGRTRKLHPITGEEVPDEAAQVPLHRYIDPRPVAWPEAEFIVGNPPFQGGKDLRVVLGDDYAQALWAVYREMPRSVDLVMYWWHKAASIVASGKALRFGLITTNSITQVFNRRVVAKHLSAAKPISLAFAIPDHPWVTEKGAAAVRVAMTVGLRGERDGVLWRSVRELPAADGVMAVEFERAEGRIGAKLSLGADSTRPVPLKANAFVCSPGVKLHGRNFVIDADEAKWLGWPCDEDSSFPIKTFVNGRDINSLSRNVLVIDCYGLTEEILRTRYPRIYQWLFDRVKPEREGEASRSQTVDAQEYAISWWLFGKTRPELRSGLFDLDYFIVTSETSKYRFFCTVKTSTIADNRLICIASGDVFVMGVLSSREHVCWAVEFGGTLEDRPVYTKTTCFDPFPFPACDEGHKARIRELGEQLDAHRKARQAEHPELTLTGMYNVLEKVRAGTALTPAERQVYDKALIGVLRDIHDRLDAAVAEAYGWPADLPEAEMLTRLVALNRERAEEERRGIVRWLRPEFQMPRARLPAPVQEEMAVTPATTAARARAWPKRLPDRFQAVRELLAASPTPIDARRVGEGRYVA